MNSPCTIKTTGLTRYFGSHAAVYELDLEVPRGAVFAFLGRNGSGKTTTIRMLLGLLQPTRGSGSVLGCDIRDLTPEIRARVGYLPEDHRMYGWMTVRESGDFQSRFYPRWNEKVFRGVTDHFGLKSEARVRDLSRGERAGLSLALTLAPDPELLILDDPAMGLDPVARHSLMESMVYLTRREDRTIFFSSHQLEDVERVADRVAVLDGSVLRASCSLEHFRAHVKHARLIFTHAPPPLPEIPGLLRAFRTEHELRLTWVDNQGAAEQAWQALKPARVEWPPLSLEEAMLSYLGDRREKSFLRPTMEAQS